MFLAFSTGTSWGTFSILIPVVCNVFGSGDTYEMLIISIAACLSGAVCGDHCSPISDTTIMASAGAHSDHVNHVSTQLPYALTAAPVSVCRLSDCRRYCVLYGKLLSADCFAYYAVLIICNIAGYAYLYA